MYFCGPRITYEECFTKAKKKGILSMILFIFLVLTRYYQSTLFILLLAYGTYGILSAVHSMSNCVHVLCACVCVCPSQCMHMPAATDPGKALRKSAEFSQRDARKERPSCRHSGESITPPYSPYLLKGHLGAESYPSSTQRQHPRGH